MPYIGKGPPETGEPAPGAHGANRKLRAPGPEETLGGSGSGRAVKDVLVREGRRNVRINWAGFDRCGRDN